MVKNQDVDRDLFLKGTQQDSDNAAKLADCMAMMADLEQARKAGELLLLRQYNSQETIRRALYDSAFISFRRVFTGAQTRIPGQGRSLYRIPKEERVRISGHLSEKEKEILDVADKHIAHRATKEARRVEVVIDHPKDQPFALAKYTERHDLIVQLVSLSHKYYSYLKSQIDELTKCIHMGSEA